MTISTAHALAGDATAESSTECADAGPDRTGRDPAHGRDLADGILHRQRTRESAARTYARSLPIVPVHADGMVITGADGRRYLDCLSGAGTLALGHNHPVVISAIRRVLDSGAPLHTLDLATPEKDVFTGELLDCLPAGLTGPDGGARLHFCGPTGSDAVEAALKLARTATGRRGILTFTGGYHGMTAGALAVTGAVAVRTAAGTATGDVVALPYPYPYRCPFGVGNGTPDSAALSANYIERLLDDPNGGVAPPAAMIVEVVQGEGGVVPAPEHWLRAMRRITAERGIALIVDEVQTGVGRTGSLWACEHAGIAPDILVMSKAVGGGLPLAVIAYRPGLDQWAPGAHTGTFRGNTLAMAAGAATLRFVRAEGLAERARAAGAHILARLRALAGHHACLGEVRGRGLMLGIEIVDAAAPPDACGALPAAPALARRLRAECLHRGLIVELGGRDDAVVRLLPPLTITDTQVEAVLDRLSDAVETIGRTAT